MMGEQEASSEMDGFKQSATMDEVLDNKLAPVIDAVNIHVEKIYDDFNKAIYGQMQNMDRVEVSLSRMVQVLWGIVNKTNARSAALERVLLRNGLSQDDLEAEIISVEEELTGTGEWESMDMGNIANKMGLDITEGAKLPTDHGPGNPEHQR